MLKVTSVSLHVSLQCNLLFDFLRQPQCGIFRYRGEADTNYHMPLNSKVCCALLARQEWGTVPWHHFVPGTLLENLQTPISRSRKTANTKQYKESRVSYYDQLRLAPRWREAHLALVARA